MNADPADIAIESARERNARERPATPELWRAWWHVLYTLTFCVGGIVLCVAQLEAVQPIEWAIIPVSFVVANFVEYAVHRWPMHRRYKGAEAMLTLHLVHHNYFYEDTYRIEGFRDYAMIVFPPMVLNALAVGLAPVLALAAWWMFGLNTALMFYASVLGYYLLMQLIHVLCHVDPANPVLALPGLRYLWTHHKIHHTKSLMAKANFNFIVPLADLCLGTSVQDERALLRR